MRRLGLLLGLSLAGCQVVSTSPTFCSVRDESAQVLRQCDAQGEWELSLPPERETVGSYPLPKTQLLVFHCNVRDPKAFLERAELEFSHVLRKRGADEFEFSRKLREGMHDYTWRYTAAGREGVLTLWTALQDDSIHEAVITIHESRKPR